MKLYSSTFGIKFINSAECQLQTLHCLDLVKNVKVFYSFQLVKIVLKVHIRCPRRINQDKDWSITP